MVVHKEPTQLVPARHYFPFPALEFLNLVQKWVAADGRSYALAAQDPYSRNRIFLSWLKIFFLSEFSIFTTEKWYLGPHLIFLTLYHLCITGRTSGGNGTCGYHFSPIFNPFHPYIWVVSGVFFVLCLCSWSLSVYTGHQPLLHQNIPYALVNIKLYLLRSEEIFRESTAVVTAVF